jgi:hypothetical protein
MNYYVKQMEEMSAKVQELLDETTSEIVNVLDSRVQMANQKDNVTKFVKELFEKIDKTEAHRETLDLVKNSMNNLAQYVSNEPIRLSHTIAVLEQKRIAFNECKILCEDTKYSMSQHNLKEKRIEKSIKDGTVDDSRSVGSRPEKLRDIRNTKSKIQKNNPPTSATERFSEENSYNEQAEIAEENI